MNYLVLANLVGIMTHLQNTSDRFLATIAIAYCIYHGDTFIDVTGVWSLF